MTRASSGPRVRCPASAAETPTLRLFGPAREAAGTSRDRFEAATLEELLAAAVERYPDEFRTLLRRCGVWVNGEPAEGTVLLDDGDEVAVIPPVSGG